MSNQSDAISRSYLDFSEFANLKNAARNRSPEATQKVAEQFEALFVQFAIKSMRDASFGGGLMDNTQTDLYQDLLDKQIAMEIAKTGSIGFARNLSSHLGPNESGSRQTAADPVSGQPLTTAANQPLETISKSVAPILSGKASDLRPRVHEPDVARANGMIKEAKETTGPILAKWFYSERKTARVDPPTVLLKSVQTPKLTEDGSTPHQGDESATTNLNIFTNRIYSERKTPGIDGPIVFAKTLPKDLNDVVKVPESRVKGEVKALENSPASEEIEAQRHTGATNFQHTAYRSSNAQPISAQTVPARTTAVKTIASSREDFVEQLRPLAARAGAELNIPPSLLLAQSALETGWGRSIPPARDGKNSFNLFGIKADPRWTGSRAAASSIEVFDGRAARVASEFRAYSSYAESFEDYVDFLKTNPRYRSALDSTTSDEFIHGLQRAGYATDPKYADKVMSIMQGPELRSSIKNVGHDVI